MPEEKNYVVQIVCTLNGELAALKIKANCGLNSNITSHQVEIFNYSISKTNICLLVWLLDRKFSLVQRYRSGIIPDSGRG